MKRMHRRYAVLTLVVLALLLGLLLAAAPAALAKATFVTVTGTEKWAAEPTDPTVYQVTGNVVHMEFGNTFDADIGFGWDYASRTTTQVKAVAALVDGLPTDAVIQGTFVSVNVLTGTWEGTFTGTMDMQALTWSITGRGKGVAGAVTGLLMSFSEDATGPGTEWPVTFTILYPHGM